MSPSESRSVVVLELAEEFLARYRQGERPSLKEYIERHPELAAEIKDVFPAMALMENIALADDSLAGDATGQNRTAENTPPPQQLGDFRILREVGRGGMGIVYEAEQVSLGRHVALKVLPRKVLLDAAQKRRFEREAKAAARLHHTNIVPVFGVGEHEELPYYVMQFIQGLGLDEVCLELKRQRSGGGPSVTHKDVAAEAVARSLLTGLFDNGEQGLSMPPSPDSDTPMLSSSSVNLLGSNASDGKSHKATYWQSVARIGVQVADALEYAHKQGIQHRDIKPSNLLLDTRGTVWVTDFGLARAENEEHLTQTGDIVGTLRYMPPEAFEGRSDGRSDVYSLGLTLYELLALQPAFAEKDRHRLIKRVTTEEPPRLDQLHRSIPRDLVTIVHKAIDREPARRYQTAAELSADLQRFVEDEPIRARPISNGERLRRWCRHHPGVAALTAALAAILVTVSVLSLLAAARFDLLAKQQAAAAENERQARLAANEATKHEAALRKQEEAAKKQADESKKQAESNLHEAQQQKQRAEANFAKARKAVDDYFTTVSESQLLQVPGMQPLRRDLLQSALTFYQDFLTERGDDPALRGELAATYLRVGKIRSESGVGAEARQAFKQTLEHQTARAASCMACHAQARQAYEQALGMYEALTKATPQAVEWRHGLAQCYYQLGRNDEAIALWEKLVQPGQPRFRKELAEAYNMRANKYANAGKHAEALQAHQQALAIREMLIRLHPEDADAHRDLGASLHNIGELLYGKGRIAEAAAMYRRAAEHEEIAFARAPQVIVNGGSLAISQSNIADLERQLGHANEALAAYQRAVEVWRKLARDNPAVPYLLGDLLIAYHNLAIYQRQLKQIEQYQQTMRLAREVLKGLPSDSAIDLYNLACCHALLATPSPQGKEKQTAEEQAEQKREADLAMDALRKAVAAGYHRLDVFQKEKDLDVLRDREDFKALQADVTARWTAAPADKLKANQQALALRQKMAEDDPHNKRLQADLAASQHAIALIQLDLGKRDEAQTHLQQAITLREALVKDDPNNAQYQTDLALSHFALGEFYWKSGRLKEGESLWRRILASLEKPLARGEKDTTGKLHRAALHRQMANAYAEWYLWDEAAAALETAFELQPDFPDGVTWFGRAALALQTGKPDHFSRICQDFLKLPPSGAHSRHIARLNMLAPGAYADPALAVTAAQQEFAGTGKEWHLFVSGAAHYRAGLYAEAEKLLRASMDSKGNPDYLSHRWFWLALVCQRQGKGEEAKQWLRKGVQWMEQGKPERQPEGGPNNARWSQALELRLLRREAERLIEGAAVSEPMDMVLKRARAFARLDQPKKAETAIQTALTPRPNDPADWLARGRVFAELGWKDRADADFAKAAALTPEELDRFPQAGWWVVGPYPEDLQLSCPPEKDPDPSRPVAATGSAEPLHWRPAPSEPDGHVQLRQIFNADHISAYALTYVYSPDERTATLLAGGDDRVRVWLNGRLVHETTRTTAWAGDLDRVPVTLKAGRNTLLCKISQDTSSHNLYLRIADNPLDRALLHAELGLWDEAAAEFARSIDRQPSAYAQAYRIATQAQLVVGDTAAYRRYLDRLFERYDKDAGNSAELVQGVLVDGAVNPTRLVELSKQILERWKNPWAFQVVGLAHYRAGQLEKAIERLEESLKDPGWLGWQRNQGHVAELGIALAHHRLGHAKEARLWLDKAEQWYEKAIQDALASPTATANLFWWKDWPIFVVLRREAHKVILGKDLPDDPRLKKLADRMRDRLKKLDPATADYDVAILLQPEERRLRMARARRLIELKRTKEGETAEQLVDEELLTAAIERSPEDAAKRRERGDWYARHRRWKEAAADFRIWLEGRSGDDHFAWLYAAPVFAAAGDREGYRRLCRAMLERFGETDDPTVAERIAKACLLLPESAKELERAGRLADRAVTLGKDNFPNLRWILLCKGLADYRRGDFGAAVKGLDRLDSRFGLEAELTAAWHVVLAMALHRQGDAKAAREHLTEAAQLLDQHEESSYNHDWLIAWLLHREAQTLIEGKKVEPKK